MSIPQSEREKVHRRLEKLPPQEKARLLSEAADGGLRNLSPEDRVKVEQAAKELTRSGIGGLGKTGALQILAALCWFVTENFEWNSTS